MSDEFDLGIQIPEITFYFRLTNAVNWTRLFELKPELRFVQIPLWTSREQPSDEEMQHLIRRWTTRDETDFLFNLSTNMSIQEWIETTHDLQYYFAQVKSISPAYSMETHDLSQLQSKVFFKERFKCFTLKMKKVTSKLQVKELNQMQTQLIHIGQVMKIMLKMVDGIDYRVSFAPEDDDVTFQSRRVTLHASSSRNYIATNNYKMTRLPPPYESKCRKYPFSRYRIQEECVKAQGIKKYRLILPGPSVYTSNENTSFTLMHPFREKMSFGMKNSPKFQLNVSKKLEKFLVNHLKWFLFGFQPKHIQVNQLSSSHLITQLFQLNTLR